MTAKELFDYARRHKLEDAPIRICDGMAVSYYPDSQCIGLAPFELVLDVSSKEPVEFDDLNPSSQRVAYPNDWYYQG